MRALTLRDLVMWLRLNCVHEVRKLDGFLDEENWYVVADDVPISLLRVELDCESSYVAYSVLR